MIRQFALVESYANELGARCLDSRLSTHGRSQSDHNTTLVLIQHVRCFQISLPETNRESRT